MEKCPSPEQLELLTASKLAAAEQAAVATHVQSCTKCQQSVASLSPNEQTQAWKPPADDEVEPSGDSRLPEELRRHPRYRVQGVLGRGGMGTVYKAEQRLLERQVVLKVIRPDLIADEQAVQRFQREARLAARLTHPNVVAVYEAEAFGSTQMLVMEFIEGLNLAELVAERGLLPVAEACELIRQAAVGLDYVHTQGLVHRDIKPQNMFVSQTGQVKILDLGLAALKDGSQSAGSVLTADRQFLGTVDFAAPEQWESSRNVDIRADIYSLGCTFYYLLAGQTPFPSSKYSTLMQQMWAHSQAPLPPIRELRPDLPENIAAILTKMLAKNRDERFSRPEEIAVALAPFTQDCNLAEYVRTARRTTTSKLDLSRVSSIRDSRADASGKSRTQRKLIIGAAIVSVTVLAAALAMVFGPWNRRPLDSGAGSPQGGPAPVTFTGPPIKVGILHSRTGTMSISEKPVIDATVLAIDEINSRGGVLGREVKPVFEDGASHWPTFAKKAEKLITEDKVCSVFGCWTSASRRTVRPIFEKHKHLLFYPVQYEGLEESPHIVYTGAAPNQQIIPAVLWCTSRLKKKRLYLVGSDYVFPRAANAIIRDAAVEAGAEIVGEDYLRLGDTDISTIIKNILASKPEIILNTINGDSNVAFFRALRAANITSDKIPTISFSVSEEELANLNVKDVEGDYAAWNYFQSLEGAKNQEFVRAFRARFGAERIVSDPMEAAYVAVHVWAQAVKQANSDDVAEIRKAVKGQSFDAPGGQIHIDPETQHTSKFICVGQITETGSFKIVYRSDTRIDPVPYPNTRAKGRWHALLNELHLKWGGQWENPER